MQYTHRKLQRSVTETRSVSSGRPSLSSKGSTPLRYLGPDLGELDDRRGGQAHVLDADPFALAVRVVAAREDVRSREPHFGERGAVGAPADRRSPRLEPDAADGFFQVSDDFRMLQERVAHVAVLDERLDLDRRAIVLRRDFPRKLTEVLHIRVELVVLEVAHDEAQLDLWRVARDESGMHVPL